MVVTNILYTHIPFESKLHIFKTKIPNLTNPTFYLTAENGKDADSLGKRLQNDETFKRISVTNVSMAIRLHCSPRVCVRVCA